MAIKRTALIVALLLVGCSFGSDLSATRYTPADVGGEGADAPPGVDIPDADADRDADVPEVECNRPDDCRPLDGAVASDCVDGACLYICAPTRVDTNGDIALGGRGDGCECSVEVCDGADNDCDGSVDEGVAGDLCPLQAAVCEGVRAECGGTCDTETYARASGSYLTIDGLCDGVDNDCSGLVDELCCNTGFLRPVGARDRGRIQLRPSLAVSPVGEVAVAWEETDDENISDTPATDVRLRYRLLAPNLTDSGPPSTLTAEEGRAHGPNVVHDGEKFWLTYLTTTSASTTLIEIDLVRGRTDLGRQLDRGSLGSVRSPDSAAADGVRATAWVRGQGCPEGQQCIQLDVMGAENSFTGQVSDGPNAQAPAVAVAGGRVIVVWVESGDDVTLVWKVLHAGVFGRTGRLVLDNDADVYPDVARVGDGWGIVYQNTAGDRPSVWLLPVSDDGFGGEAVRLYRAEDREDTDITALAAAGHRSGLGAVYFEAHEMFLGFASRDPLNAGVTRGLNRDAIMDRYSLDLAVDPRTQLVGVAALETNDDPVTMDLQIFWLNLDGQTLCRP